MSGFVELRLKLVIFNFVSLCDPIKAPAHRSVFETKLDNVSFT